jgi:hypothetical protein
MRAKLQTSSIKLQGNVKFQAANFPHALEFECWIFPEVCGLKLEVSAARQGQEAAA